MQLTRGTDFSLRVLMHLAPLSRQAVRSAELAAALKVPRHQVMKIVQRLARAGYLETLRGNGGGVRLAMAPDAIRIGDVIRRIEPSLAIVNCLSPHCPMAGRCRLKHVFDRGRDRFMQEMDAHTLADVAVTVTTA